MAYNAKAVLNFVRSRLGAPEGSGSEVAFTCPFCIDRIGSESDKKKLWFNSRKGRAYCFRCQYAAKSLEKFLRDVVGGPLTGDVAALLSGYVERDGDISIRDELLVRLYHRPNDELNPLERHNLPAEYIDIVPYLTGEKPTPILLRNAVAYYLKVRRLPSSKAAEYAVGYCRVGTYAGRLLFPVRQNGQIVYFTTRYCGDHPVKSLNPPNVEGFYHKTDVLLNYDNVVGCPVVALCEGPISAMAHRHAVCLLGKTIAAPQIALLERLVSLGLKELVVSLDSDASKQARQIYNALLGRIPKVTLLTLASGDPDDNREIIDTLMEKRSAPTIGGTLRSRLGRVAHRSCQLLA